MKSILSTNLNILTIMAFFMIAFTSSDVDNVTTIKKTSSLNIGYVKASTLQTPATTSKKIDLSYTVPKSADTSKLPYAVTVKGTATGVQLAENFDPKTSDYDLNALAVGQTITLNVRAPVSAQITINGNHVKPNADYKIGITEISKNNNIIITVQLAGDSVKKYTIHTYNRNLPTLNYKVEKNANLKDGIYTFALSPYLIRMNTGGHILYYRSLQFLKSQGQTLNFNFKPVEYSDGTKRFTFGIGVDNASRVTGGYTNGICVVMDENYKEIKHINLQPYGWHSAGYLDDHDFILLSDNHWICESYTKRDVDNIPNDVISKNGRGKVVAGIIQEVNNGKVIMEFDTTDHPFFYETAKEKNDFTSDNYQEYAHINSLCIDPTDGNLVVSMRNQYAVYKINRKTGNIMWVLGGDGDQFNLDSTQKFVGQHAAYFANDGSLLLYNNNTSTGQTQIMNFYLDETNKAVKFLKSYTVADYYGDYCGNAFETGNGSGIIDWGMSLKKSSPIFTEVNLQTGEILSTLASDVTHSYRTYKSTF